MFFYSRKNLFPALVVNYVNYELLLLWTEPPEYRK